MKTVLVALGVLAALVASGSATVEQASAAGMDGPVPLALVVLLEVVNVAGTWTWMTDPRPHVQVEAATGVAVASLVTGTCGALSYGPIGVVPAVGVLFTVHLGGRLRHRSAKPGVEESTEPAVAAPLPDFAPRRIAAVDPAAIGQGAAASFAWMPSAPAATPVDRPEPEPVDDPETVELRLPDPEPEPVAEFEPDEQDPDGEQEPDEEPEGHSIDYRIVPWHQLTKEQAQAEARRLTNRGHRVVQRNKPRDVLRADVRDARRALGEEPAA